MNNYSIRKTHKRKIPLTTYYTNIIKKGFGQCRTGVKQLQTKETGCRLFKEIQYFFFVSVNLLNL